MEAARAARCREILRASPGRHLSQTSPWDKSAEKEGTAVGPEKGQPQKECGADLSLIKEWGTTRCVTA